MSEERKYPYIGKGSPSGSIVMFYSQGNGITLDSKYWASTNMEHYRGLDEYHFKNITREYLTNTYGEVKSKEHAEFIKLLAETGGMGCGHKVIDDNCKYFYVLDGDLFFNSEKIKGARFKKITIPLPPKSAATSKVNRDIERAVKGKINDELDSPKTENEKHLFDGNKYHREIIGLDGTKTTVDVYRVLDAFKTDCAATDHAIKKMLCAGLRGHKDKLTDYDNAIESLIAARDLLTQKHLN